MAPRINGWLILDRYSSIAERLWFGICMMFERCPDRCSIYFRTLPFKPKIENMLPDAARWAVLDDSIMSLRLNSHRVKGCASPAGCSEYFWYAASPEQPFWFCSIFVHRSSLILSRSGGMHVALEYDGSVARAQMTTVCGPRKVRGNTPKQYFLVGFRSYERVHILS